MEGRSDNEPVRVEDVERLARRYVVTLSEWLTQEEFEAVAHGCAGDEHDYCDANMAMDEAHRALGWGAPHTTDETPYYCAMWCYAAGLEHLAEPYDLRLWNAAAWRSREILDEL